MAVNREGRENHKYIEEGRAFHKQHGYSPYTMVFNKTLEAEMMDKDLPGEWRVLSAIKRYAWGNFSNFAVTCRPRKSEVDEIPKPLTQDKLGEILGIQPSHISEICKTLRESEYIRKDHRFLYPEVRVSPFESSKPSRSHLPTPSNIHSPFVRFVQEYIEQNPPIKQTLTEIEATCKRAEEQRKTAIQERRRINLQILAAFRNSKRDKTA